MFSIAHYCLSLRNVRSFILCESKTEGGTGDMKCIEWVLLKYNLLKTSLNFEFL